MGLECLESRGGVGHMGGAAGEAVQTIVNAFFVAIVVQPVLGTHVREHTGEAVGEDILTGGYLLVGGLGERL